MSHEVLMLAVRHAYHFAVASMFMLGTAVVFNLFVWNWLAWLIAAALAYVIRDSFDVAGDKLYGQSTDAAAWCIRKFRSFNAKDAS